MTEMREEPIEIVTQIAISHADSNRKNDVPYLTSGTVIELSAILVAKITLRTFIFNGRIANLACDGSEVECKMIRIIFVSAFLQEMDKMISFLFLSAEQLSACANTHRGTHSFSILNMVLIS